VKGKLSVAYRTSSIESSCGSSLVTDPKGPSDMNVQSAYLHSAFLEVQFWQAGLPSSPMAGISIRYVSVTACPGFLHHLTFSPSLATRQASFARSPLLFRYLPDYRHLDTSTTTIAHHGASITSSGPSFSKKVDTTRSKAAP
jgi:hypothetical protein